MDGIFINYRREDSMATAGRLYDRLVQRFGKERVFMDIDTISPGDDFDTVIDEMCASCAVFLALIGKSWASAVDKSGQRRLDRSDDFVGREIARAIVRDVLVVPVLLDDAEMPAPEALPNSLRKLAFKNAVRVSNLKFHRDVDALVEVIQLQIKAVDPAGQTKIERNNLLSKQSPWKLSPSDELTADEKNAVKGGSARLQSAEQGGSFRLEDFFTKLSIDFLTEGLSIEQTARVVNEIAQGRRRRASLASSFLVVSLSACGAILCAQSGSYLIAGGVGSLILALFFGYTLLKTRTTLQDGYVGYKNSTRGDFLRHRGELYFQAKDHLSAFCWFYRAAEAGDARSAFILGSWYERGGVVTRNVEEARLWYEKAASRGDAEAKQKLGPSLV